MPIRVAQVMGKMLGGGVESVVMNYYRHIDRNKVQFDFLVDDDSTRVPEEEIKELGGRVLHIPPYQHPLRYRKELVRLFREEHWPIVHSHINTLSVFPLSAAKKAGVPVRIAHSHSSMGKGELTKNLMKLALRPLSNLYPTERFACSEYAGKWLFGRDADFTVIPNAIELEKFCFDPIIRQETRRELGIADDMFLVGHVGRFMPQKIRLSSSTFSTSSFPRSRTRYSRSLVTAQTGQTYSSTPKHSALATTFCSWVSARTSTTFTRHSMLSVCRAVMKVWAWSPSKPRSPDAPASSAIRFRTKLMYLGSRHSFPFRSQTLGLRRSFGYRGPTSVNKLIQIKSLIFTILKNSQKRYALNMNIFRVKKLSEQAN